MISFFRAPIRNTKPSAQASILQIYKYIISNRASDITRRLRAITDPKEARKYKSEAFDYVTFSGCFSSRCTDELIEHSGFLCFDIDKIESERRLQEIKSLLINDEELHTVLCFRSPSGNGLKWVVEVPDRHWLRSYSPPCLRGSGQRPRGSEYQYNKKPPPPLRTHPPIPPHATQYRHRPYLRHSSPMLPLL